MCVLLYVCECVCKQKVKRERERLCLCELQHHHSSKILLTIECRLPVRTRRKHFSWVMEKRGLGWTAWLQFFRFQGLLSHHFPKFRAQEKKREKKEQADRERKKKENLERCDKSEDRNESRMSSILILLFFLLFFNAYECPHRRVD